MDHVVKLKTSMREASIQKQHLWAVFFDLEKAYETTWKFGIMKDLHSLGLRGKSPYFIKSFLSDRQFRSESDQFFLISTNRKRESLKAVVCQWHCLIKKINIIIRCLTPVIDGYLCVDDFCISLPDQNIWELLSVNCNITSIR